MSRLQPTRDQVILSLVEEAAVPRVFNMIFRAIEFSFIVCPCRMTQREVKRRFDFAYYIWETLRAECRYPLTRIEDALPHYLRLRIDGAEWHPLKRRTWVPGDPIGLSRHGLG